MATQGRLILGVYDGLACDGVDATVVRLTGHGEAVRAEPIAEGFYPYEASVSERLARWHGRGGRPAWDHTRGVLDDLARVRHDVAGALARAGRKLMAGAGLTAGDLAGAGVSGHSVLLAGGAPNRVENPSRRVFLCESADLAAAWGVPVVSDFEASLVAAGGLGVGACAWPLWRMLRDDRLSRVVVHLGGVVHVTFVGSAAAADEVQSFDAAWGTVVLDALCRAHFGVDDDADGALAARGEVREDLAVELLAQRFFQDAPPKALSALDWGDDAVTRLGLMAENLAVGPQDLLATCTEVVARATAEAVGRLTERPHEVVLTGGGAKNIHLAGRVRALLCPSSTYTAERYGLTVRGARATCLAMLAGARLDGFAAHCPAAGGATRRAVLGSVWRP